jgi:hypothetical protein
MQLELIRTRVRRRISCIRAADVLTSSDRLACHAVMIARIETREQGTEFAASDFNFNFEARDVRDHHNSY